MKEQVPDLLAPDPIPTAAFSEEARRAVYEVMALRRDIRHFRAEEDVDAAIIGRILSAAHLAPSVGFSQPWGFVVIRNRARRERVRASFLACREAEAARYPSDRREQYLSYRLEGILESAVNVCVAVDLRPQPEAILGTTVQPEAVRASACCAVQNLWLAARAEGVGVGWVSIIEPAVLRAELALPPGVEPIAYLCIGRPVAFRSRPMLEEAGWRPRRPLTEVVHAERWPAEPAAAAAGQPPVGPALAAIPSFDEAARRAAVDHFAARTKPVGSLGRLEQLATWYAGARGGFPAPLQRATLALFAADHGVVVEGVSAYGSQLTAAMVCNVMAGGAAVNALAGKYGVDLVLVDVGVAGDLSAVPRQPVVPLVQEKIRAGTANLNKTAALSRAETSAALAVGERVCAAAVQAGAELLGVGELGIGNTTAAAALVCALTGQPPAAVVGRGTGIDDEVLLRKTAVVEAALARARLQTDDPLGLFAQLGGLELAAMAGFLLAAARRRIPVVLDGFLATAAALFARACEPGVVPYLLASHASAERGASAALAALGLQPVFDLGLRLGEGTGALIAMDLVRAAVTTQLSMASFATAGIVGRTGTPVARPVASPAAPGDDAPVDAR